MTISEIRLDVFGETVGVGGGFVALQSLLTIKKGTSLFQCSIEWALFEVSKITNGHFKIFIRYILGKSEVCVYVCGGREI